MNTYVDIDGTVADASTRSKYLTNQDIPSSQRWGMFFDPNRISRDSMLPGSEVLNNLLGSDQHSVTFITGRPERTRQVTDEWLSRYLPNYNPDLHTLIMKPDGNMNPTGPWKVQKLKELGEGDDFVFIDDEPSNRTSMSESFPTATVLSPDEGWAHIKGLYEESGESSAVEAEEPTTNAMPEEDYSDMM